MSHPAAPYAAAVARSLTPAEREAEITEMLAQTDALSSLSEAERQARVDAILARAYKLPTAEAQARWSEARLGQECGLWLQAFHRAAYDCFFHIPNGGLRTAVESASFKAQHAKAGVPDYLLAWPCADARARRWQNGLFIELKTATGRVAPAQLAWHERLRAQGYRVEVVRSLPAFISLLTEYLA